MIIMARQQIQGKRIRERMRAFDRRMDRFTESEDHRERRVRAFRNALLEQLGVSPSVYIDEAPPDSNNRITPRMVAAAEMANQLAFELTDRCVPESVYSNPNVWQIIVSAVNMGSSEIITDVVGLVVNLIDPTRTGDE